MNVRTDNFSFLLAGMLLLLVGIPLAEDFANWDAPTLRAVAFSLVLIICLGSLAANKRWLYVGVSIMAIGVVLNFLAARTFDPTLIVASLAFILVFLLMMTATALRQVVFGTVINWNRIVGAVCVYLLLGALWSIAYMLVFTLDPTAFRGIGESNGHIDQQDFQYFSFVTLTTLGYGDIVPLSATVKTLAFLEAILGQLYVAILVAALVGAYVAGQHDKRGD